MKKLMIFLMVAIPLVIIILVNFTVEVVVGNVSIAVDRIELDRTEITANIDETISLEATIYPKNATNQEIIWESTNEQVARVDLDGNVSFVGFGNGYITATTADGNKMASCYYYVTDSRVHSVKLTTPKAELHVGTNVQLDVEIVPYEAENKYVTFSSSDEEIARVDQNGLVTGLKVGYVTITVTTEDEQYSDFVNLKVTNPVEDIQLNKTYDVTGEPNYSIGYQIMPSTATNTNIICVIDDESVATVNNLGQVSFLKAGTVEVTLTTVDGGFSKTMTIVYTAGYAQSLQLEKYSITAMIGDAAQVIEYSTMPNYLASTQVTFSSSNEDVAFVRGGYLYFVGGGSATITVSVEKAAGEYISEHIIVYVESPATGILIEDVVTAEKTVQLQPSSFPENSTNNKFFYHTSSNEVSVNENGLVTFLTDNPTTAEITIYANSDYSNVSTTVSVEYTAGKAKTFELSEEKITMLYGSSAAIGYTIFPSNANASAVQVEVLSQKNNSGSGDVVEILPDGTLRGIGGGKAQVQVSLVLLGGEKVSHTLEVEVLRHIDDIDIHVELEQQNGEYVTAVNTVSFAASISPADASDKTITWSLDDKNMGVILGETFMFNQSGVVTLIATTSSGYQESVQIRYTGSYPISAEVGMVVDGNIETMPQMINVGDEIEVAIKEVFPSDTINKNISLSVSNQQTSSLLGKVLEINGTTIQAVAGGQATLTVRVSTTVILTFEITVYQKVESIEVTPSNIQTTNSSLTLQANVSPIDATNKGVTYQVLTPEIAYIDGDTLYFKQDGVAQILAISQDNQEITYQFTIEKIAKGTGVVDPTEDEIEMFVGDSNKLDFSSQGISYDNLEIMFAQDADTSVIEINGDTIVALTSGQTQIICILYDAFGSPLNSYQITVTVKQLVENIIYVGQLEEYNGYLTTAKDVISLDFAALPEEATDVDLSYRIISIHDLDGVAANNIAAIDSSSNTLKWFSSGALTLEVSSADGNITKTFRFKYTGGDPLAAEINISREISLNVGESITIEVLKWTPSDTVNKQILIRETNHTTGVNVISIDSQNLTITALSGGFSNIRIELSNGLTQDITINVIKKVTSIVVSEENIVTASNTAVINATAYPSSATNKTLSYQIEKVDFATLDGNTVTFTSAGTVVVTISTMDGSDIYKQVTVTSTMGYLHSIDLNVTARTISKRASFSLYVTQTYPFDATNKDVQFKILSQTAADESQNDVISITQNGSTILVHGLYGGSAIVRAYSYNSLGEEVYTDCVVTVSSPVESIEIDFVSEIEFYRNYYVTSQNQIFFNEIVKPLDATNRDFVYTISDPTKATVEDGVITFHQIGTVTITFTSADRTNGEISVSYIFSYAGDTLLEASLNLDPFDNGVLRLNAGEEVTLTLNNWVPKDNVNVSIILTNLSEERNDSSKAVLSFENGVLKALNGGEATFELMANNISLGSFKVIVTRQASDIWVENEQIYVSSAGYQINAQVLPTDTSNKELIYQTNNPSIATVDEFGAVSFSGYGVVVITIILEENPSISKQITIEYTREIKDISFSQTKDAMYVNDYVVLTVEPQPIYAEGYSYSFSLSDPSVATIEQIDDLQWRLRGIKAGEVVVTLSVDGTEISYSHTFTFYTKITDLRLELDNEGNDAYGFGGYRVFANKFVDSSGKLTNQFVMNFSTSPSDKDYSDLIEWSSSNDQIATVDQYGRITFKGTGVVTITASQIPPYENANVVWDSYTFYIVEGINVYNFEQYKAAISELEKTNANKTDNFSALVLHGDIIMQQNSLSHALNYNIYGNGYMIDFSNDSNYEKINITRSNLVIDNVVLRGNTFSGEGALSQLENKGKILKISGNVKNVLIYNTIIENAHILAEVISSQAYFQGCILRNSFSGGLVLARTKDDKVAPNVIVEDCILSNSLFSCILFKPDTSSQLEGYESKLTLKGDVRIYNWLTLDEFEGSSILGFFEEYGLSNVGDDIINKIKDAIRTKYSQYKYTYKGEDYYMFGILQFYASVYNMFTFQSNGIIDRSGLNSNFNYADCKLDETIPIIGDISGDLEVDLLTFYGYDETDPEEDRPKPFIAPNDTYEANPVILGEIRQPRRDSELGF